VDEIKFESFIIEYFSHTNKHQSKFFKFIKNIKNQMDLQKITLLVPKVDSLFM
jgi:hypothetical protein